MQSKRTVRSFLLHQRGMSRITSSDPIDSSPVLSFDGKKIAWVTTTGKVQVLTIGTTGSNGTSPTAPVCIGTFPLVGTNNAVLASVTLNGSPTVTNSAVFVDYISDTGYVGDDSGKLHKFTPFFNGSLTEVTTGGWPVTVSSAATKILTGPVFDSVSNNIFVGDNEGTAGKLFYVRIAAGSLGTCSAGQSALRGERERHGFHQNGAFGLACGGFVERVGLHADVQCGRNKR